GDPSDQRVRGGLQVDDEVRLRRIVIERCRDLLVEAKLVGVEVQLSEQAVGVEQKVRDPVRRELVGQADRLDLPRALQKEEQRRRQRSVPAVAIEALEERVLVGLLENQLAREALREALREAGLADADRPLDDDETRSVDRDDALAIAHGPVFRDPFGPDATLTD